MDTRSSPIPPAAVEALRRTVDGLVAYPTDPAFDAINADHPGHSRPDIRPDVLVVPSSEEAVRAAVDIARAHGLHLMDQHTRGGTDARPTMLVLTHLLDEVVVDHAGCTATVGPGTSWTRLATHIRAADLTTRSVGSPDATVMDSVMAGTAESLSARVVRADGFVHVVDDVRPPRDESGTWVVTALVLQLHPADRTTATAGARPTSVTDERIPS